MTEVCPKGHIRTEANTRWNKYGRGDKLKRVCLECKREKYRESYQGYGQPAGHEIQVQRTTYLHEDVEDLLRFGATLEEIIQRAGFSSLKRLKTSLRRRERFDLLERVEAKQEIASNADLSTRAIHRNASSKTGFAVRSRNRQ